MCCDAFGLGKSHKKKVSIQWKKDHWCTSNFHSLLLSRWAGVQLSSAQQWFSGLGMIGLMVEQTQSSARWEKASSHSSLSRVPREKIIKGKMVAPTRLLKPCPVYGCCSASCPAVCLWPSWLTWSWPPSWAFFFPLLFQVPLMLLHLDCGLCLIAMASILHLNLSLPKYSSKQPLPNFLTRCAKILRCRTKEGGWSLISLVVSVHSGSGSALLTFWAVLHCLHCPSSSFFSLLIWLTARWGYLDFICPEHEKQSHWCSWLKSSSASEENSSVTLLQWE